MEILEKPKRIICFGPSQNGKSSFINFFGTIPKKALQGSDAGYSCTTSCQEYERAQGIGGKYFFLNVS